MVRIVTAPALAARPNRRGCQEENEGPFLPASHS